MKLVRRLMQRLHRVEPRERRLELFEASVSDDSLPEPEYVYHILDADSGEQLGRMELRLGHDPAIEFLGNVGYSIRANFRGHHYAAQACRLLAPIAREKGMDYLTITCDTDNAASRKTIESLGARCLGILTRKIQINASHAYTHEKYNYLWSLKGENDDEL